MDLIKGEQMGNHYLDLLWFDDCKGYEIQYSDDEEILETDGIYNNKKSALIAYDDFKKDLLLRSL